MNISDTRGGDGNCCCPNCNDHRADDIPHRIEEQKKKTKKMSVLKKRAFQVPVNQMKMKTKGRNAK